MSKTNFLKSMLIAAMLLVGSATFAQQKYAVLICGGSIENPVAESQEYSDGQKNYEYKDAEFWNDTYLMWQTLRANDFSEENIIVLFRNGIDYPTSNVVQNYPDNYVPSASEHVTDAAATYTNVVNTFAHLAQVITPDDFLFVWVHGESFIINYHPGIIKYLALYNYDKISIEEFAQAANAATPNKRAFWMANNLGSEFKDALCNSSVTTYFHAADDYITHTADDLTKEGHPVIENDDSNNPLSDHSEFNFHMYAVTNGASPLGFTDYDGEPYTAVDTHPQYQGNSDGFISMAETSAWEVLHQSIADETPVVNDQGQIGPYTSLQYPTLLWGNITQNNSVRGLIGVSKDTYIKAGNTLTFKANSQTIFENNSRLVVEAGAELVIEPGASFKNGEIVFEAPQLTFDISNVKFAGTRLHGKLNTATISNCTFYNCKAVELKNTKYVTIHGSLFEGSHLRLKAPALQIASSTIRTEITGNIFIKPDNCVHRAIISIDRFKSFIIRNNSITASKGTGIQVLNSGNILEKKIVVEYNEIEHCAEAGIEIYNSLVNVYQNNVHDNKFGIKLLNHSNARVYGKASATKVSGTQRFTDNDSYEVYADESSFPANFHWNAIVDEDNGGNSHGDPLFFYDYNCTVPGAQRLDARFNYWGNNFVPEEDLHPYQCITYNPVWVLETNGVENAPAYTAYSNALNAYNNNDYSTANNTLRQLISNYPQTVYAESAMKLLFNLNDAFATPYADLITYYQSTDSIQQNAHLQKTATFLINKCEIALKNYNTAIAHYEDIINNSSSENERIFAEIDLGYLYEKIEAEGGNRAAYAATMPQYRPVSEQAFVQQRDLLLSQIPNTENTLSPKTSRVASTAIVEAYPNPSYGQLAIDYNLSTEAKVQIAFYDISGKLVYHIAQGTQAEGSYHIDINLSHLPAGVYFYSLQSNDNTTAKMHKLVLSK